MRRFASMLAFFLLAAPAASLADVPTPPARPDVIDLPMLSDAPAIDGDVSRPQWGRASRISLAYNLRSNKSAEERTTAYIATDGRYLFVGFNALQSLPVRASQRTDEVGENNDDQVTVYLWPNGSAGFRYSFTSTPLGTHYQQSSENTVYTPNWLSSGRLSPEGYTVTMRIPLSAIRGSASRTWRVQFARTIAQSGDEFVWSHGDAQQYGQEDALAFAGTLKAAGATASTAQPRFGLYGLGEARSRSEGSSTSRMGLDMSIPVTANGSFIATFHPDYSNVELDQQTIAPTAYARSLTEVRPFFTQGANFYDHFSCIGCPGVLELYTPSIPTPREGYAIEGKTGLFTLAAFDAVGSGRLDMAQSVNYKSKDLQNSAIFERIAVAKPGMTDSVAVLSATHDSLRGLFEYVTFGGEYGSAVSDASLARRREAGVGVYSHDAYLDFALRNIGSQYSPADGFVQHPDIAGYDLNGGKTWYYAASSPLKSVRFVGEIDRYHQAGGLLNQSDTTLSLQLDSRSLWHTQVQIGSSYLRMADGTFAPISQNGFELHYRYGTAAHSSVSYYTGRFGPGRLDSWTRTATARVGDRGTLVANANDDVQYVNGGSRRTEWLEKLSYTFQSSRASSFAAGIRRVLGVPPVVALASPSSPVSAWNVTAAYHQRFEHAEVYVVYGDAGALSTAHQFIVKLIRYVGAQKGT